MCDDHTHKLEFHTLCGFSNTYVSHNGVRLGVIYFRDKERYLQNRNQINYKSWIQKKDVELNSTPKQCMEIEKEILEFEKIS